MTGALQNDTLDKWIPLLAGKTSGQLTDEIYAWAIPTDQAKKDKIRLLYDELVSLTGPQSANKGAAAKTTKGERNRLVGQVYEKLLRLLFDQGVLSVEGNIRTTTGEVDLLLKIEPSGCWLPLLRDLGTHVIGEAKCHAKAPSSELVNELRGFIDTHSAKLAFLFVFCKSRSLAPDARQAIALHGAQGRYIVPLGRKQIEQVIAGVPVCKILSEQRVHAANATSKLSI
jgi:hypothetical protein